MSTQKAFSIIAIERKKSFIKHLLFVIIIIGSMPLKTNGSLIV